LGRIFKEKPSALEEWKQYMKLKNISLLILASLFVSVPGFAQVNLPNCRALKEGLCFNAAASVTEIAIDRAQYIVEQMLQNSSDLRKKMVDRGFVIEIIGQDQVLTDLPRYKYLKNRETFDGRDFDLTRGVGDEKACSIGEENLLCSKGQMYYNENILVHEFAHSILYYMSSQLKSQVNQAFAEAKKKKLYPKEIYMMADVNEYWATATQAWFDAVTRIDINAGINKRAKILKHDPELAKILQTIYGLTKISSVESCLY
jgi:hypothetical protein